MDENAQIEAAARAGAMRGIGVVFVAFCAAGIAVAWRTVLNTGFTASGPSLYVTSVAIGMLLGWMATFVVFEFRLDRIRERLWKDAEARGVRRPAPGESGG